MNRILWMADEIIAQTVPQNWNRVTQVSNELFKLIGNPVFTHDVVEPQNCIGKLASCLGKEKFSSIIDLTGGWLGNAMQGVFPGTPVVTGFHISRVRDVSDPRLPTSGHVISWLKCQNVCYY